MPAAAPLARHASPAQIPTPRARNGATTRGEKKRTGGG